MSLYPRRPFLLRPPPTKRMKLKLRQTIAASSDIRAAVMSASKQNAFVSIQVFDSLFSNVVWVAKRRKLSSFGNFLLPYTVLKNLKS